MVIHADDAGTGTVKMWLFPVILIVLGVLFIAAAIFNWEVLYVFSETKILDYVGGEMAVRIFCALLGIATIIATLVRWLS